MREKSTQHFNVDFFILNIQIDICPVRIDFKTILAFSLKLICTCAAKSANSPLLSTTYFAFCDIGHIQVVLLWVSLCQIKFSSLTLLFAKC